MTTLIIAAHPDDEVLGCGGSIKKWSDAGEEVHILIVAEGSTSRDNNRNQKKHMNIIAKLRDAARASSKILGAKSVNFLSLPDNRMDSLDLLDIVKLIEKHINEIKPKVVVTHHVGDVNIDHQILHQAVITACRPIPKFNVKKILAFETVSSTEWQPSNSKTPFTPNYYEDISQSLKYKMKALKKYDIEMRNWPHSRSYQSVEYLAKYRGFTVGLNNAEAFLLLREIND